MSAFRAVRSICLTATIASLCLLLVGCASTQEQATTAGPAGSPLKTSGKAAGPQTGKPALDMAHIQDLKRQILAGQPAAH